MTIIPRRADRSHDTITRNMKLFFDARYIRTDFHDGISRYSTQLGNALADLTKVTFLIHDQEQIKFLPSGAEFIKIHAPTSAKEPFTAMVLNRYNPDVVFSPMQTMGSIDRRYKLILTTHDLIYYRHRTPPKTFSPAVRAGWFLYHLSYIPQRLSLNNADMVATVSSTVMRELEQNRLTNKPIIVIPNAPQDLRQFVKKVSTDKPANIVYMGSFMPYKNVETLIKAMKWLPKHKLHLLSKISDARIKELKQIIPKGAKVIFYNGISDEEYAKILADNAILASASLDEGYGLPVAEGIAMGVPAVISDIPIFHEVAAGGALYFNPHQPKDFADKVLELNNKSIRDQIISTGVKHMQTFSWDNSARSLLNAMRSLVSSDTIKEYGNKKEEVG